MFGETTISYVKIGNHPIETTIYKWLFGVPGIYKFSKSLHGKIHMKTLGPHLQGILRIAKGQMCRTNISQPQRNEGSNRKRRLQRATNVKLKG